MGNSLLEFVLKTRTALSVDDGVVAEVVVVVDPGAGVVPMHSYPSQGHPAAQFSLKHH